MGLAQNAAQCSHRNFVVFRNDRGVDRIFGASNKLHVTPLLGSLYEACRLKPTLNLAEGLRLKPPNLDLDLPNIGWSGGTGSLEVEFKGFLQVLQSLFLTMSLTSYVNFEALGNIPVPLTPNRSSERTFHIRILSQPG